MDDLYQPGITDLELDEYQGNERPVVYLDEAKRYCEEKCRRLMVEHAAIESSLDQEIMSLKAKLRGVNGE